MRSESDPQLGALLADLKHDLFRLLMAEAKLSPQTNLC